MALCEVVVAIADAIEAARQPLTPTEVCLLHVIRGIPYYRDINRLDAWEAACNAITPNNLPSTTTGGLLDELIMLCLCNMYQMFQPARTLDYYGRLIPYFAAAGIEVPKNPDLSGW